MSLQLPKVVAPLSILFTSVTDSTFRDYVYEFTDTVVDFNSESIMCFKLFFLIVSAVLIRVSHDLRSFKKYAIIISNQIVIQCNF